MFMKIKLLIYVGVLLIGLTLGYTVNDWKRDSQDLKIKEALDLILQEQQQFQLKEALAFEKRLKEIKNNERIIHTKEKEIVERPIYINDCIDVDGLSIIKQYANGE